MDVSLANVRVWVIVGPCVAPVHHWCGNWAKMGDAAGCSQAMEVCAMTRGGGCVGRRQRARFAGGDQGERIAAR